VRLLLGAAIPLLLSLLVALEGNTRADLRAAIRPHAKPLAYIPVRNVPQLSPWFPAFPFDEGDNLRFYVERARP